MKKKNNKNLLLLVVLIICLITFGFIVGYAQGRNNGKNFSCKQYFDIGNFPPFLDKLTSDCGGTQFYLRDGNWNVWRQDCKIGGYCKYDYFPIYNCLK